MTKNIIVVDEHGKKCGTTYSRRAKGLVKQGRARFLARNILCLTHCLACPPDQDLEDKNMLEQTMENRIMETWTMGNGTAGETSVKNESNTCSEGGQSKYTMEYCLEQIERIGHQTEYLNQAMSELRQMEEGSDSSSVKAMALGDIVKCRETTNQQMLRFYEKMYDDLKAPAAVDVVTRKAQLQEHLLKSLDSAIENGIENGIFSSNEISDLFNGAFDAVRHIND